MLNNLLVELMWFANKEKAEVLQRFFKTWKWQYWEWDKFHWIVIPTIRLMVKEYYKLIDFKWIQILLDSEFHEERILGAFILVAKFEKSKDINERELLYNFYMNNLHWINNWDLVDLSAPNIAWKYLIDKNKDILYDLAISNNLWQRRIAIISTLSFIREWLYEDTIKISQLLMNDKEDLIHKACWWMLREMWKRDEKSLIDFLDINVIKLPRTTLRYAIERLDNDRRNYYLKYKI